MSNWKCEKCGVPYANNAMGCLNCGHSTGSYRIEEPTVQPSLSARELAQKVIDLVGDLCEQEFANGYQVERVASLIDQAIEDAANPYKEAFEELAEAMDTIDTQDGEVRIAGRWVKAPLTRALLTKEEKSDD